jgi:hypothetical protein
MMTKDQNGRHSPDRREGATSTATGFSQDQSRGAVGGRQDRDAAPRSHPPDDVGNPLSQRVHTLREAGKFLTHCIRRSPGLSIGIAVGCGLALGWLVKRR